MDFSEFLQDSNKITDEDVIKLRREVFQDMLVSRVEAEAVFALNNSVQETSKSWNEFFVEVMTDYCINQAKPKGYMSENNAEWLISQIDHDGHLDTNSELELLVKVIERASEVPTQLSAYALNQVKIAVLEGNGPLLCDNELKPGVIGAPEAQLIRRIMYGVGAEGRIAISKEEVQVLFDLNDQTVEVENDPEWTDVFIKAVACHLMAAGGYQVADRQEALQREKWLEDTSTDVAGFLSKTLSSVGDLMRSGNFSLSTRSMEDAWAERNQELIARQQQTNPVDEAEAHWLTDRIGRDGVIHDNEKALLSYLKQESISLHPSLDKLIQKVA